MLLACKTLKNDRNHTPLPYEGVSCPDDAIVNEKTQGTWRWMSTGARGWLRTGCNCVPFKFVCWNLPPGYCEELTALISWWWWHLHEGIPVLVRDASSHLPVFHMRSFFESKVMAVWDMGPHPSSHTVSASRLTQWDGRLLIPINISDYDISL